MNTKEETTQRQSGITGESALAIISVALAAFWIAFAYYHGGSTDGDGNRILLLHPLVPIALIVLLVRIYRYVGIKFVVHLEIIMIGLWIFVRMLGVFMPFILGFGFAYLFRFLWRALPFKKYYQRVIATVLIVVVCTSVIIFTGIAVGNQLNQMAKGLQKYFHEILIPFVNGEEFVDIVYDESGEDKTLYLATDHGIYIYQLDKEPVSSEKPKRIGITNGEIVGKRINAISVNNDYIYAGTDSGVYRCDKDIVKVVTGRTDELSETTETSPRPGFIRKIWHMLIGKREESVVALSNKLVWKKIDTEFFDTRPVKAINTPSWNSDLIYVGTANGLFFSEDAGDEWDDDAAPFRNQPIRHITSIEKYDAKRDEVPKATARKNIPMYIASLVEKEQIAQQLEQGRENNSDVSQDTSDTQNKNSKKLVPSKIIINVVYRRTSPSGEWKEITNVSDDIPRIFKLAAIDFKENKNEELYAGTGNGVYEYYNHNSWKLMDDSTRLPQSVTLLASAPTGLYAGNAEVIHFRSNETKTWRRVIEKEDGILVYKDSEIVMQFQEYITEKIPGWTASGGAFVRWVSGLAGSIAFQFGGFMATLFLAFIVFVYASQGFNKYTRGFIGLVPEKHRETAMAYLREIDRNMHQFLKGQFTVIVIISILSCIIYHIIGVPFALLVGLMAGLCNAIPTFGPFIGGGFAYSAMLMGLAAGEFADPYNFLFRCLLVLGGILGIQTIDNSLISPNVMSNAVDIDPLLIMFSVIVGASILGFWGVLLAIPIIVVIKSILTVSKAAANGGDPMPTQEQS